MAFFSICYTLMGSGVWCCNLYCILFPSQPVVHAEFVTAGTPASESDSENCRYFKNHSARIRLNIQDTPLPQLLLNLAIDPILFS
ncbi:hypothetical protein I7I48_10350 [Histoplasma ohiense]|nr:hypothetical protein I7I48_10350 [Histoplasma ohiense (nom. inval.)]